MTVSVPGQDARLLGLARKLLRADDQEQTLNVAVAGTMELVEASRGFLVLTGGQKPDYRVVRNWDLESGEAANDRVSSSIVSYVIDSAEPLFVADAMFDERFAHAESVIEKTVRSVMAAPFNLSEKSHGVLYLERSQTMIPFADEDFEFFLQALDLCGRQIQHGMRGFDRQVSEIPERREIPGFEFPGLLPQNPAFRTQLEIAARAAQQEGLSILIQGPSGTGKELVASAIHRASPRRDMPLKILNCGAVSDSLVRSELFGHVRGAFTGAQQNRIGLLASADGGTVFLDEIGELPLEVQPVLLRALQSGEIHPVGSDRPTRVDFRLVSATNRDLERDVEEGRFREDLFFRINTVTIDVPPLRQRREDIPPLFDYFVRKYNQGKDVRLTDKLSQAIVRYDWPGNVRQLENEAQRVLAIREPRSLKLRHQHLSKRILDSIDREPPKTLEESQRELVVDHLRYAGGNKTKAAGTLGVSREGLRKMLDRLEIPETDWASSP